MPYRMAIVHALVLALGVGLVAASAQMSKPAADVQEPPSNAHGLPLSWAPEWLVKPLSRAIADATDPRERSKETGAPKD